MRWKENKLTTFDDFMFLGINKCESPEEAQEFMRLLREEGKFADVNIGYLSGYYSREEGRRIREWFGVNHPFIHEDMTPEQIFNAGVELGKQFQNKGGE